MIDYKRIKMVVSDMDGTLLNSSHQVSEKFFKLFEQLHKHQIRFVAASGRQFPSMRSKLHPIEQQMSFIAENGALIVEQDQVLHKQALDYNHLTHLLEKLQSLPEIESILCSERTAYSLSTNLHFHGLLNEYYEAHTLIHTIDQAQDAILKLALYHKGGGEKHIYPHFEAYDGPLKVKVSGDFWVDISDKNANKGFALETLMKKYSVAPEELLVFGDYNNDLEMLALTPNSVAMANAHQKVLESTNYTTRSNDQFGVELILEELVKNR
jgi:Cof subfamily protein (haloacid dehalogenase superfamily)